MHKVGLHVTTPLAPQARIGAEYRNRWNLVVLRMRSKSKWRASVELYSIPTGFHCN